MLGLHRPSAGRGELFGIDAWRDPVVAHRHVAYVAGEPFLWPALTSEETFDFLARLHGGTDVTDRETLVERFQLDVRKKVRALSKGTRQKVQLIAALAARADLLLLDEPTSGLDPLMEVAFRDCVAEAKERGQTVFLSSHILSEVEALCDRVGILRRGRVPRASGAIAYALVTVAFLWDLIGSLLGAPKWLVELTPFQHVGLVPAEPFRGQAAVIMVGIGVLAALAALAVFRRRDLIEQ